MQRRGWVSGTLRLAAFGLCLFLLAQAVDWRESLALLAQADLRWLGAALALLTVQTLLSAQRWRITAAQLGIHLGLRRAVREYYLSQVINQSLPGGVLGDAGRALRARDQAGLMASGQAVIFERVAGQIGLLTLLAAGLAVTLAWPDAQGWPSWLAEPVKAVCWAVVLALPVAALGWRAMPRLAETVRSTTSAFRRALWSAEVRRAQIALSLATALCNVTAFAFCAAAVGSPLSVLATLTLVPMILFAMVLPLSIGGWGLREGAASVLFPAVGATMSAGLASSIAFGLVLVVSVLPGVVLMWTRPGQAETGSAASDGLPRGVKF